MEAKLDEVEAELGGKGPVGGSVGTAVGRSDGERVGLGVGFGRMTKGLTVGARVEPETGRVRSKQQRSATSHRRPPILLPAHRAHCAPVSSGIRPPIQESGL